MTNIKCPKGHEILQTVFTEETKKIGNDTIFSLVRTNQLFEKYKPGYYTFLFCSRCNRPYLEIDCISTTFENPELLKHENTGEKDDKESCDHNFTLASNSHLQVIAACSKCGSLYHAFLKKVELDPNCKWHYEYENTEDKKND